MPMPDTAFFYMGRRFVPGYILHEAGTIIFILLEFEDMFYFVTCI